MADLEQFMIAIATAPAFAGRVSLGRSTAETTETIEEAA
jgi:hypothetical protein